MSWSKGNKKWTIPFVSLGGTSCRIDIYQRGYTGSTVTELSTANSSAPGIPASDPFFFEEDNDENLLSVVRVKSGYINLIETVQDGLTELHPATNVDHYIEMYYGSTLYFNGFIQAQSIENDWANVPREVSLPIVSMLGVLGGYYFTYKNSPSMLTLKSLVQEILQTTDSLYDYCVFPHLGGFSAAGGVFDNYTLLSLVISPYSDRWENSNQVSDMYEPVSYLQFIEGLCSCFGLIVYDEPRRITFTKFDHDGSYFYMQRTGTCTNISGLDSVYDLDSVTRVCRDDNSISEILPLNKLTIKYDGEVVRSAEMNFDKCYKVASSSQLSGWSMAYCSPIIGDFASSFMVTSGLYIGAGGFITQNATVIKGTFMVAAGEGSMTEQIICQCPPGNSWASDTPLFQWTCFNPPSGSFKLLFNALFGPGIDKLSESPTFPAVDNPQVSIYLTCGNYVWNQNNTRWDTTSSPLVSTIGGDREFAIGKPPVHAPIVVTFYIYPNSWYVGDMLSFRTLKLAFGDTIVGEYIGLTVRNRDRVINGTPSPEEGEITALFHHNAQTDHKLIKTTAAGFLPLEGYEYLLQAQTRLIVGCNVTDDSLMTMYHHCRLYQYWQTAWRWRMISATFHPWNDEWLLTLHRSPVIEQQNQN